MAVDNLKDTIAGIEEVIVIIAKGITNTPKN